MSFSTEIKKELSEINNLAKKEEVKYELLGYLLSNNIAKEKNKIKYSTENEYNINRFAKLLKNMNINDFSIDIQGKVFNIEVKKKYIDNIEFENITNINNLDYIKSLVRGIYLGSGSINNPESKYHLEIELKNFEIVNDIVQILKNYDILVKSIDKAIYIKDGEEISKFLAFIGASKSVLKFEEIRVQREMNNKINRLVNCETANLNKVINASVEQIEAIKKLKKNGKFENMSDSLKEISELRLEHPDFSLIELGKELQQPIGKSGVNYRLKKIIELSKECD